MVRIGINGFGRVGRQSLRTILERQPDLEIAAVNDLAPAKNLAHLFKYDSTYGRYPGSVSSGENDLVVDGHEIRVFSERSPDKIPWDQANVDIVLEATGRFTSAKDASGHLRTAKKTIICAPAKEEDITIVLGVNEQAYDPEKHHVISNASCTTNGLAPVAKVLHDTFEIKKGLLTTVHAYTSTQGLLDIVTNDLRDSRAAPQNIIPSATGAARAVGLVIPELQGRFTGMAFRVPTTTVSVVDFTASLGREVTVEEVNAAFKQAAEGDLEGIMAYTEEPLVSSDFRGDPHSTIVSAVDTIAIGDMVKVISWYDNEYGYSCRVADLTAYVAARLPVAVG